MDCIFCKIVAGEIPSHKVYEDDQVLAFLDVRPASRGHTIIIPKEHAADLFDISRETLRTTMDAVQTVARTLRSKLRPDGMNMFQNNGSVAGQSVFHYHVHLVPRWTDVAALRGRQEQADDEALAAVAAELRDA